MASGAHRRVDAFNAVHAQRKLPYYDVLGVPLTATQPQIISAYRKLSLKLHPDKPGGSNELFQELNKAYKCLKDSISRRKYDDCGFDEDNLPSDEVDQFVDAFFGESARNIDGRSGDWSCGSIENYVPIDLEEVPFHMKDIIRIGLNYIVSLEHEFENVVLLQHARVDILYLMVGLLVPGGLTQKVFEGEDSYSMTYYDNPLQPGIAPRWSDQNRCNGKQCRKKELPRKELNFEEFQRRQKIALAMLENSPADPMFALEEKYRAQMMATEHERKHIADVNRIAAIRGQDVYEEDGELDCNAYAGYLAQEAKEAKDDNLVTDFPPASCTHVARDANAEDEAQLGCTKHSESLVNCTTQGTEKVLGLSSDGVLFVAKDGEVLRNEGPPRPQ